MNPSTNPMMVSDLIRELQEVLKNHGDMPIVYFTGAEAKQPEVFVGIHRTGDRVFIWSKAQ